MRTLCLNVFTQENLGQVPQVRKVVNSRGRPKQLRTLNRNNGYHFRPSLKQNADVIDLGMHTTDKSHLDPNKFVRGYLSNDNPLDYEYLASRIFIVGMLEGDMIHAFQILLQKQFPAFHGLYLPRLVEMCTNELVVDKSRDWVQIIHVANRAHWVCVHKRSGDDYVRLYDSLKSPIISEHIGEQVLSIQGTDTVLFKHENVAQQKGAEDCGLFALAFATSICFNEITSVQFDQERMRDHYFKCLTNKEISIFPSKPETCRRSTRLESALIAYSKK